MWLERLSSTSIKNFHLVSQKKGLTGLGDIELELDGLMNLAVVMVQVTSVNSFVACGHIWKDKTPKTIMR